MAKPRKVVIGRPPGEKDESEVRWLISYSDFMMQLVCLFIMLYSVSSLDKGKMAKAAAAYRASIGRGDPPAQTQPSAGDRLAVGDRPLVGGEVQGGDMPLDLGFKVEEVPGGWRVTFNHPTFDAGSAAITPAGKAALDAAAATIRAYAGQAVVTSYAGDTPEDALEGDALRLAAARAENVVAHLTREGFARALDRRFVTALAGGAGREKQARRVIILLRTE